MNIIELLNTIIEDIQLLKAGHCIPDEDSCNATLLNLEKIKEKITEDGYILIQ
jgi:glycerate-2-kinase